MSYKREVGKGRDRAPESMIIPFLKHIKRYNIKKRKSVFCHFFYYKKHGDTEFFKQ